MNYCSNCGNKVDSEAYVCPKCGVLLKKNQISNNNDSGSIGYGILGFFFPLFSVLNGEFRCLGWKENYLNSL